MVKKSAALFDLKARKFFTAFAACFLFFPLSSFLSAIPQVVDTIRLSQNSTLDHPVPIIANPGDGSIFIGGYYSDNIIKYDPVNKKILGEIKGVKAPLDFRIANGKLYIYGYKEKWWLSCIFVYDAVTLTKLSEIPDTFGPILSFDVDPVNNVLYYGTWGKVAKVNLANGTQELLVDLGKPAWSYTVSSIDVDVERNRLYLVGYNWSPSTDHSADVINVDLQAQQVAATIPIGINPVGYDIRYDADIDGENLFVTQMYTSSITVVNMVSNTVVKNIPDVSWPQRLVIDRAKHHLYAVDNYADKFHVIDTLTLELVKSFSPGDDPSGVCIDTARNRIYTANVWTQDVGVIDATNETFMESISFAPATPLDVEIDSNKSLAYISNGPNSGLFVVDTKSNKLVDKVNPYSFVDEGVYTYASGVMHIFTGELEVMTPPGQSDPHAYTLDEFNKGIALFNLNTKTYVQNITPEGSPTSLAAYNGKLYFPYLNNSNLYLGISDGWNSVTPVLVGPSEGAQGIAINPKTQKCYIADYSNNQVVVMNLADNSFIKRINVGNFPACVGVDADSNRIYLSNYGSNSLSVIDGASDSLLASINVGAKPWGIGVNSAAKRVYAVNTEDNTLSIINARKNSVVSTLPVNKGARYCGLDLAASKIYLPGQSSGTVTVVEDIVDGTPPVIECPSSITVETLDVGGMAVTFAAPKVSDDSDSNPVVTVTPASGTKFPVGATTVKVQAEDSSGNVSQCSFVVTVKLRECAKPVGDLTAAALPGRKIELTWTLSPTAGVASYRVYSGTGTINFNTPSAILSAAEKSWTAKNLLSGVTYKFVVRALHTSGCEEQNMNVVSAAPFETPPCLSAGIKSPHNGMKVSGERLTVVAETSCENSQVVKSVRFEYKSASEGDSQWRLILAANSEHPNPDLTFPYFVHWNVSALSNGEYCVRAVASDENGISDISPSFITIHVDHADPDSSERTKEDGKQEKIEKVGNHKANNVIITDPKLEVPAKVQIPAGALSQQETKVTLQLNLESVNKDERVDVTLKSAGTKIEISLENGQHQLELQSEATLTLPYPDENKDGVVDGTDIQEKDLAVYYFDPAKGKWDKLAGSTVDTSQKSVSAKTSHFSLFGLFSSQSSALAIIDGTFRLGEVYVFPNPAKDGKTPVIHVETGLADRVDLRFYDLSGILVHSAQMTGEQLQVFDDKYAYEYSWDVSGVASGVYIVSVNAVKDGDGGGSWKKLIKAAVVR